MLSYTFQFVLVTLISLTSAFILPEKLWPRSSTTGFSNPQPGTSAANKATCVSGILQVQATANGTKILLSEPANNNAITQLLVEITSANSSIGSTTYGGPSVISGEFDIFSKLCLPTQNTSTISTVQFLTHGGTLDNSYWDLAPNYSYIDAAADAGYATFSYDRLGTGKSDHPDPIQVVQLPFQIELAHVLIEKLRAGTIGGQSFEKVVGVGHSLGSGITQGLAIEYPKDFDALILTGTSTTTAYSSLGIASTSQQIANTIASGRFDGLANGYMTPAPVPQSVQFAFYKYPFFVPAIFEQQFNNVQTNALGETFTGASPYAVAPDFTGPVDTVNGDSDLFFCGGNCYYPEDQAALVQPVFFPNASNGSQSLLVPDCGHVINAHYNAPQAFQHMISFLKSNNIY